MAFVLRVAKMMWLWLAGGFALLRHTRGFQTIRWFHVKALNISLVNATQIQGEETLRWDDCGAIPCRFFNLRGKATNNELWQDRNKRQTQFNERNFKWSACVISEGAPLRVVRSMTWSQTPISTLKRRTAGSSKWILTPIFLVYFREVRLFLAISCYFSLFSLV